jgi:hypothetical protein
MYHYGTIRVNEQGGKDIMMMTQACFTSVKKGKEA